MSAVTVQHPFLRASSLTKRFGDVTANRQIDLSIRAGRIHALLGENGAGKSTLIALLSGMAQPDAGEIILNNEAVHFVSPAAAQSAGITSVFQRSNLVAELSVDENFRLYRHADKGFLDAAHTILERLLGQRLKPSTLLGRLDLGVRQLVEISRAIAAKPQLLILDEPTALIDRERTERLLDELNRLKDAHVAVLFVSHKLPEVLALADDITVLRQGEVAFTSDAEAMRASGESIDQAALMRAMFGEEIPVAAAMPETEVAQNSQGSSAEPQNGMSTEVALKLDGVYTRPSSNGFALEDVTLEAFQGQILAVAGISGNGQRTLAAVIEGSIQPQSGRIMLGDKDITSLSIKDRMRLGVVSLTDDRFGAGLATGLSVALNLLLTRIGEHPFWRFCFTQPRKVREYAVTQVEAHGIHVDDVDSPAGRLSGGNAQKVLLARAFAAHPAVTVLHQPTHGLDVKTVAAVHASIREAAQAGQAVILISADLDEIVALAHRVVVLDAGRIVAEIDGQRAETRDRVAQAISAGVS